MTNTNCLEDIRCPKCGQEDRFFITGCAQFEVTDDGSEAVGGHEWDDESSTRCPGCGHDAPLKDFRVRPDLPPDPEGKNDDHAAWAGAAVARFIEVTATDEEDALGDLLADLMHWSDRNNYDFDAALDRARLHYEAETTPESSP
ncbi:MAG: hypothetical protein C0501_02450 [Isosphaera sp.]|nr:hypothetical protein [Isosphaera sp.]